MKFKWVWYEDIWGETISIHSFGAATLRKETSQKTYI